jgi:hypothetical protein
MFSINTCVAQSEVVIYVSPDVNSVAPGESFNVTINIANAQNVYSWMINLTWDPTVLNVTSVQEGTFLKREVYTTIFHPFIYNDAGYIMAVCVLQGQPRSASASGDGTLVTVTFSVEDRGSTAIHLHYTELRDYDVMELPHTVKHGYFAYPIAKLLLDPPSVVNSSLISGSTFNVNISILDVEDLYSWMFYLTWDPTVLNVTNVQEGNFLSQQDAQTTAFDVAYPEAGTVCVNCTLVGQPIVTANGNGTLATIEFIVRDYGNTLLDLNNTKLLDSHVIEIPHSVEGSYFTNVIYDIAVKSVEASTYNVKVGDTVSITVTVKNEGSVAESSRVRIWANISLIGTIPVTNLASGDQKLFTLDWNTGDIAEGKYVIKAEADILPGETDTNDNTLIMEDVIQVTQPQQQLPTTLIIVAAVIIIILVVVIMFYYTKRKHSSKV